MALLCARHRRLSRYMLLDPATIGCCQWGRHRCSSHAWGGTRVTLVSAVVPTVFAGLRICSGPGWLVWVPQNQVPETASTGLDIPGSFVDCPQRQLPLLRMRALFFQTDLQQGVLLTDLLPLVDAFVSHQRPHELRTVGHFFKECRKFS